MVSAFECFVRSVESGKFPKLDDRNDLWPVLLRLTSNKAKNAIRDENRERRGQGVDLHPIAGGDSDRDGLAVAAAEPDPAEAAALAEEAEILLAALPATQLKQIAVWRLEGHTVKEIARMMGRSVATVERKLDLIRTIWQGQRADCTE